MPVEGEVTWISGPVVRAEGLSKAMMYETMLVGRDKIIGEVIRITGDEGYIQVYESTSGMSPGEKVEGTGEPLSVTLGPGLLTSIYDGLQRPLEDIAEQTGAFIQRGVTVNSLDFDKEWEFTPTVEEGDQIGPGTVLGTVPETPLIEHRVMAPPDVEPGSVTRISPQGEYTLDESIATVTRNGEDEDLYMYHKWPVRDPRPIRDRLDPTEPLITGQRVIDSFFPVAKGGTAAIPGGFGTGKTVALHQVSSWADAEVVLHVGCGERGNEMTEVLLEFPELEDPQSGRPLMERTVLVANTSNMPVAAREASIYTAITMAEYYRDMGYDVVLAADSTSRWAEALREISGRLEEMPAEEGFPPYLASRLAEFYERAGRVIPQGSTDRKGSVTVIGAVSPPGGDFTEPVTSHTLRFIETFWALDTDLAYSRHYPAINWITSYSGYLDYIEEWWTENVDSDWADVRRNVFDILEQENELQEIVRLLGPEALPDPQKVVLDSARLIKQGFLQQNAYDEVDTYCPPIKQAKLLEVMESYYQEAKKALDRGVPLGHIRELPISTTIVRAKEDIENDEESMKEFDELLQKIDREFAKLEAVEEEVYVS